MDRILIRGGRPLSGKLPISGAKNAALTLLPCALLTEEPVTLRNLPRLADVDSFGHLLNQLGVSAQDDPLDLLPLGKKMVQLVDNGKGVLILTDIFGASPSNLAMKLLERGRIEGLAGVNLPMLLRAINYREKGMETLLLRARDGGRDGVFNMLDH